MCISACVRECIIVKRTFPIALTIAWWVFTEVPETPTVSIFRVHNTEVRSG